jgi:hypothetical protein
MDDTATHLRHLIKERDQLNAQIEALRNKVEGLEIAIKLISGRSPPATSTNGRTAHVSQTILGLLRDSGDAGLKPMDAIGLAARHGISLNRGSVYTLLNRMERSGVVVHEDARYKLREFAGLRRATAIEAAE